MNKKNNLEKKITSLEAPCSLDFNHTSQMSNQNSIKNSTKTANGTESPEINHKA